MDILKSIIVWTIGICYLVILFPLTFLIWIMVLPFDRKRAITHWLLVYQSYLLSVLIPIWSMRIEGRSRAVKNETYVIISNHQSLLDILLINCLRYRFCWISKIENIKVPVLGWYLRMAGYITVNRGDEESKAEMLKKSHACLRGGTSIMIFPEGTRSPDGELGFFRRGAFQLAIEAGVPILPVVIDGTAGILPKHGLVFGSGHRVVIRVLDPLPPDAFGTDNPDLLSQMMQALIRSELAGIREGGVR